MSRLRVVLPAVGLCLALGVAGCAKKAPAPAPAPPPPPPATTPAPPPPPPPPAPAPAPEAPRPLTDEELFARKSLDDLNSEKPLGDVFFAYDQSTISDEGRATIQRNMEWLRKWQSTRVLVEGHCDNRGTPEYNLALGEQRAAAVRDYLVSLGLPTDRVTIVSKGEEQPFCNEDTEECFQQNRRGHFLITAK
ncbi:MAG: OmpA family protein [Acidobacteria bacterium]|nr:OmpA family protein [Acidobacteriota bacterium]